MDLSIEQLREKLQDAGLKITPQRLAILEAVYRLGNHPTAEGIFEFIRSSNPAIATGTVYNTLDTLVDVGLVRRVKTEKDSMRYDGILEKHHHLYCAETDRIEDYFDAELDQILMDHFSKKGIPDFRISDIILQIKGNFEESK